MSEASEPRPTGSALAEKAQASASEAWAKMKPLVVSTAAASGMVALIFLLGRVRFDKDSLWLSVPHAFFNAAISAPLAVAVHRLILKGEVTPGIISFNRHYQWMFFVWLCALALLNLALSSVFDGVRLLVPVAGMFTFFVRLVLSFFILVLAIGVFVFSIKSALIFPAVAIEAPSSNWRDRLQTSWRQMDGNFWLFVRALLLAILPLVLATLIVAVASGVLAIMASVVGTKIVAVAQVMLAMIIQPAGVMFAAGVASWLYLWVRENPSA